MDVISIDPTTAGIVGSAVLAVFAGAAKIGQTVLARHLTTLDAMASNLSESAKAQTSTALSLAELARQQEGARRCLERLLDHAGLSLRVSPAPPPTPLPPPSPARRRPEVV